MENKREKNEERIEVYFYYYEVENNSFKEPEEIKVYGRNFILQIIPIKVKFYINGILYN